MKQMGISELFAWVLLITVATAFTFYTLGFNEGKKDGFWRGRSAGLKIGQDRRSING